ncbi:MAG: TetR/AcrR family transcriptional regulator [Planctomycetia bacterium]|nr:TetR/AcrR family transcriptional regulator [Planctomycetia bacterium]
MDETPRAANSCEGLHKPQIPCLSDSPEGLSEVAQARREQILDATEAIIAGHGIQKLSLGRIEQQAEMSRGQLTYYFPTKESILLAVYDRMLRRMIREALQADGPKPMTGHAWDCAQHALRKHLDTDWPPPTARELFSLLFTFLAQMGHREDYRRRLSQWYSDWRGFIAADITSSVPEPRAASPKVLAAIMQSLFLGLDIQLMIDPEAFDRQEMFETCVRLLAPLFQPTNSPSAQSQEG